MNAREFFLEAAATPGNTLYQLRRETVEESGGHVRWGDLTPLSQYDRPTADTTVVVNDYLTFGDYDNSTAVERANVVAVEKMTDVDAVENESGIHPDAVLNLSGGHGSGGVAFAYTDPVSAQEILNVTAALSDYPLLDDEAHSNMEMEMYQEAWVDYGAGDYVRELMAGLDQEAEMSDSQRDDIEEFIEDQDPMRLFEAYDTLGDAWSRGLMMIEGGGSVYFQFEEAIKNAGGAVAVYHWLLEQADDNDPRDRAWEQMMSPADDADRFCPNCEGAFYADDPDTLGGTACPNCDLESLVVMDDDLRRRARASEMF